MNPARLAEAERNLTGISRKVFTAVPCTETWSTHQVYSELARIGKRVDFTTLEGCLNHLVRDGLVKEPVRGSFIRVPVPSKVVPAEAVASPSPPVLTIVPKPKDAMDQLAAIAETARSLAAQLNKLAKDIEDAALEVEGRIEAASADGAKLRQLQTLLKSLT